MTYTVEYTRNGVTLARMPFESESDARALIAEHQFRPRDVVFLRCPDGRVERYPEERPAKRRVVDRGDTRIEYDECA